ncbi:MAG: pyridoxal phosphate-dependent decarboxylase family protein [Chitinophagales bacterium]
MLSNSEFRKQGHKVIDWIAYYLENIEKFPVKSQVHPGEIRDQLQISAPETGESIENIFSDFKRIIPAGITHWQHPGFMALFPSNASYESMLGEFLAAGLAINAMVWETSPAATELEERMMDWLKEIFHLPANFKGVIHDTASISTLTAIISAREKYSDFNINKSGFQNYEKLILYCSDQTHYSIEKGAKAAGIGLNNVRKITTDENYALQPDLLIKQIAEDRDNGFQPYMVVATLGTTSSLAFDPLSEIGKICNDNNLWLHVDAAYAGSAFILEEYQHFLNGIDFADSYVVNAHKWLFTNFDCSLYFVKDTRHLVNTFSSNPEYLKRTIDDVINYKDWGIPLGRRFRALKLWFVLRSFGVDGLKSKLREHMRLAEMFYENIQSSPGWEIMAPFEMNVLCIRHHPETIAENELNNHNRRILNKINETGEFFLSGTMLRDNFVIRVVIGQTNVEERHVWSLLEKLNQNIS